jgi:hypothetical protein
LRADSEYHISFHSLPTFSDQNLLNIHKKVTKLRLKNRMLGNFLSGHTFFNLENIWFCSFLNGQSNVGNPNFGTFNF